MPLDDGYTHIPPTIGLPKRINVPQAPDRINKAVTINALSTALSGMKPDKSNNINVNKLIVT